MIPAIAVVEKKTSTASRRRDSLTLLQEDEENKEKLRVRNRQATVDEILEKMKTQTTRISLKNLSSSQESPSKFWRFFDVVIYSAIMVNSVQLGVQVDYPDFVDLYYFLDLVCNIIFICEFLIKIKTLGVKRYFTDGWNVFDFTLVLTSSLDFAIGEMGGDSGNFGGLPGLRVLRMLRAVRVMRMLKVFRELWLIVRGIALSLKAMFWVILLLIMILYMCAILCTTVMQESGTQYPGYSTRDEISGGENMEYFNPSEFFGSIPRSMYTLFQLALLTEFGEFARPIFEIQPVFFPFFIAFIFLVTFGVLNVLIAVIVEVTMDASASLKEEEGNSEMRRKLQLLDQLRGFIFRLDADRTGEITLKQLHEAHKDEVVQNALLEMGFPMDFTVDELWQLFDRDGNGSLTVSEFISMAYRVVSCSTDQFQFQCMLLSSLSRLQQTVNELKTNHATTHGSQPLASPSQPLASCASSNAGPSAPETTIPSLTQHKDSPDPNYKWDGQTPHCNGSRRKRKHRGGCRVLITGSHWLSRRTCRPLLSGRRALISRSCSRRVGENKQAIIERVEQLLPEVRSNPTGEVRAEKVQALLKDRVHGTIPQRMLPEEIKPLLDWRTDADGNLRYCELMEGITRLAACRDDTYEYKCLMLSIVREARSEAAAARRACNALLFHCETLWQPPQS